MTLLDEWDLGDPGAVGGLRQSIPGISLDDGQDDYPASPTGPPEAAGICSLERLAKRRGKGRATSVAVGSECLLVVTSRAVLLRYDFTIGSQPVSEMELSRAPDAHATHVWLDPTATHALVAVTIGNTLGSSSELLYVHAKWKKPRTLTQLKGSRITAVAWHHTKVTDGSTGPVLLGTRKGTLQALSVDEKDKKDAALTQLYDFEDAPEPIGGLLQQPLPGNKALVLVATPSRLYAFIGGPTLEALFKSYPDSAADLHNCLHCPGEGPPAGLLQLWAPQGSGRARHMCWLSQGGIRHGSLLLDLETRPPSDLDYLRLDPDMPNPSAEPVLSMALTQFHILLLSARSLHLVGRVSGRGVQEVLLSSLGGAFAQPSAPVPSLALLRDAETSTIYLAAGDGLFEVAMDNEERDLWRAFLERADYAAARRYANTQAERDVVSRAEARVAFDAGDYARAAQLWGAMRGGEPSFEEVALRFVGAGATDALQAFLMARLQVLGPDDKAQATMVASWVVELCLDQINRALLEEESAEGTSAGAASAEAFLRAFLRDHVDVLDEHVTVGLLAAYGRMDDLMHYATYRQDNETVLEYLLQRGEALKALAVLRRPGVSQELVYKFAPALIAAVPAETIDSWIAASPPLDPRRLMPALMRAEGGDPLPPTRPRAPQAEALRYVQFCIARLGSTDATVHNLAVSLYSQEREERELLGYLQGAKDLLGRPLYDAQFALRVARQHGHLHACVQLLCELNLHEDAVALALTFDRKAASAVAARAEDDEALQRKLWLAIARHLIDAASDKSDPAADPGQRVAAVVEVLDEAEGRIRIEDVLPLFPDFVTIDAFKGAICASLEDYKAQIERLKAEMGDATRMADALRRDMAALEGQAGTLDLAEPCARCGRALGTVPRADAEHTGGAVPQFYLFPTGNAFHGACLAAEALASAPPQQRAKLQGILKRLAQMSPDGGGKERDDLVKSLDAAIAVEDPYNGEVVVRMISQGFIDAGEAAEIASWQL